MSAASPETTLLPAPPNLDPVDTPLSLPGDVEQALVYLRSRVQARPQDPRLQFLRERAGIRFFDQNTLPWVVDPLTAGETSARLRAGDHVPVSVRRLPYAVMAILHPGGNPLLSEAFDLMLATAPDRIHVRSVDGLREQFAAACDGLHVQPIGITGVVFAREPQPALVAARRSLAVAVNAQVWTTSVDGGLLSLDRWPLGALQREAETESWWSAGAWEYIGLVVPGGDAAPSGINALFGLEVPSHEELVRGTTDAREHFESDDLRIVGSTGWAEGANATSASLAAALEHFGIERSKIGDRYAPAEEHAILDELRALRFDAPHDPSEGPRRFATHHAQALIEQYPALDRAVRELQDQVGETPDDLDAGVLPWLRPVLEALDSLRPTPGFSRLYEAVVDLVSDDVFGGTRELPARLIADADDDVGLLLYGASLRASEDDAPEYIARMHERFKGMPLAQLFEVDAIASIAEPSADVVARGYRLCLDALEALPDQPTLRHSAALLESRLGKDEEAFASASRAIELDPAWPEYLATRARIERRRSRLADARRDYRDAIELAGRLQEADWQDLSAWIDTWTTELETIDKGGNG